MLPGCEIWHELGLGAPQAFAPLERLEIAEGYNQQFVQRVHAGIRITKVAVLNQVHPGLVVLPDLRVDLGINRGRLRVLGSTIITKSLIKAS